MTRKPSRGNRPPAGRPQTSAAGAETGNGDHDAIFREAMRGVVRHQPSREPQRPPPPDALPRQRLKDDAEVMHESLYGDDGDVLIAAGDVLDYRAPGVNEAVYRKLRRGQFHVRDELDLHGMNSREARIAVAAFLARCRASNQRCVRIVHGKGLRSTGDGPVLKRLLDGWLRRRKDVLAFCSARREHGGAGAVYVLLRAAD